MENAVNSVINFLILYFMYYYVLRFVQIVFYTSLGTINDGIRRVLYAISTPAHELAHLIMALICLAQIESVKLFPGNNEPGHVKYRVSSRYKFMLSIKSFFIGIAPALINIPLFIFIESKFVLKNTGLNISQIIEPRFLLTKEGLITLALFSIFVSGIAPSFADLKGMFNGLVILSVLIFIVGYLSGKLIKVNVFNMKCLIDLSIYYLEVIAVPFVITMLIHYRNWYRAVFAVLKSSIKNTFSKN